MNKLKTAIISSIILSQSIGVSYARQKDKTLLTSTQQKLGYALGIEMGKSLKVMHPDIDIDALIVGFKDAYYGKTLLIDKDEAKRLKDNFRQKRFRQNKIAQNNKQLLLKESKKTMKEKAVEKPAYSLDFGMVDQTNPRNAAWSFAILYNDISPVFTANHIDKICGIMAAPKFLAGCKHLLQERLSLLKKDIKTIKEAIFTNPTAIKSNKGQNSYILTWDETFTSQNDQRHTKHKKLDVQLEKNNNWQVKSAQFIK